MEYADFECPYCGLAEPVVRELLADFGDLRYVWRHLPLRDVHPNAQLAAEASEAAAGQGAFWEMHDLLMAHQGALRLPDLLRYAGELGLDVPAFTRALRGTRTPRGSREDIDSRRPERGLGHADVLRQRAAPPRRVRHRLADRGDPARQGPQRRTPLAGIKG